MNLWKKTDGLCHLCRKVNIFFIIKKKMNIYKKISKILQIETNAKSKILMPVLAVIEKKEEI